MPQAQTRKKRKTKKKAAQKKAPNGKVPARAKPKLKVEYLGLGELEQWPRNPKLHDIEVIKGSIRRFGFTLPVVIDEATGKLVAGHGRQEALSQMKVANEDPPKNIQVRRGEWLVPVVRGNEFASEQEAESYLIADNRLVEVGGWDPEMLTAMLEGFEGPDLAAIGFSEEELRRIAEMTEEHEPPEKFVQFTASDVKTNHKCPRCNFEWSE
jgi:hypothetical protein